MYWHGEFYNVISYFPQFPDDNLRTSGKPHSPIIICAKRSCLSSSHCISRRTSYIMRRINLHFYVDAKNRWASWGEWGSSRSLRIFEWSLLLSFYLTLPLHHLYSSYSLFYSVSGLMANFHKDYHSSNTAMLVLRIIYSSWEHDLPILMRQVFENLV